MEHLNYKTGDLFHCIGHGFLSSAISKATHSIVSHTATFIYVWGKPYIVDSQKDGTNLRPFYEWKRDYNYKYIVTRTNKDFNEKDFAIKALSICGITSYDFALLCLRHPATLAWSAITGKEFVPKKIKGEENRMVCSEAAAWIQGFDNPEQFSPKKLLDFTYKNKHQIIFNNITK